MADEDDAIEVHRIGGLLKTARMSAAGASQTAIASALRNSANANRPLQRTEVMGIPGCVFMPACS